VDPNHTPKLRAVWGTTATDVWTAGESFNGIYTALFHSFGQQNYFNSVELEMDETINALAGLTSSDVLFVGDLGTIYHLDGVMWAPMVSGTVYNLEGVWRSPDGETAFVVGEQGSLLYQVGRLPTPDGGACAEPVDAYCDDSVWGSNAGRADTMSSYGCAGRNDTGGEVFYRFLSAVDGQVTLTLTPKAGDLDLIVLAGDTDGTCDTATCVTASQNTGDDTQEIIADLPVEQGQIYYLVVDGYDGAVAGFHLLVDCTRQ
jgi:hypothetical protein